MCELLLIQKKGPRVFRQKNDQDLDSVKQHRQGDYREVATNISEAYIPFVLLTFLIEYSRDNGITFPCMFIMHISFTISIHIPNQSVRESNSLTIR
jgi:hypothetical protein